MKEKSMFLNGDKSPMSIAMVAVNHERADLDVRSCFAFTQRGAKDAMHACLAMEGVSGCVILATCNRTELYVSANCGEMPDLKNVLCALKGLSKREFTDCMEVLEDEEVVRHLFFTAAGLCSQIIGEDQILTQVSEAAQSAAEEKTIDSVLFRLFQNAVSAGKKVKSRVAMPHGNSSLTDAALDMLKATGRTFRNKKILVIGNGAMGKLSADRLLAEGATVTMTIRQHRRGVVMTPDGVLRMDYDDRYFEIPNSDYVFSATSSPHCTITGDALRLCKLEKEVVFVDLALPRDMEPEIDFLENVVRYDIDDFKTDVISEELSLAISEADRILEEEIEAFLFWHRTKDMAPRINALGQFVALDVLGRLEKPLKVSGGHTDEYLREAILRATAKSFDKLLFGMRDAVEPSVVRECLTVMEQLYV